MWFGSPFSFSKSSFETLWKGTPVMRFKMGSRLVTLPPFFSSYFASTLGLVSRSTQSRRRSTVIGRMTLP